MPNIPQLRESRAAKIAEAKALNGAAEAAARDLTDTERGRFDALTAEIRDIGTRIERAEQIDALDRVAESTDGGRFRPGDLRRYSFFKAVNEFADSRLTGLEAEVHAELSNGRNVRGFMAPTETLLERRALTTDNDPKGGYLVKTDQAAMSDMRRSRLMVEAMGATILRNLNGDLDLPRQASSGTAHWIGEREDTTGSDMGFSIAAMTPKTISAKYELSRRLRLQANESAETIMRHDLGYILAQGVDLAAINGSGVNQPLGILGNSAVLSLADADLTSDLTADLIGALEVDNVSGTTAFLTNPVNMTKARKLQDQDDHVIPLSEIFHGMRIEASNQVPATSSGPTKYPLIYGEWASLYIGYWSAVDILVNPYHSDVADRGGVMLHAFLDCDVIARHPEAFRWAEVN